MGVLQITCPSLPYMSPLCSWGLRGDRDEDLESLTFLVTPSHKSVRVTGLVVVQRTHTPALREKPRRGSGDQKRQSFHAGGERDGRSHLNLDKIIRILFLPVERRATPGEGWQKGERERRRFSSCERWVLLTFSSWGGLTCMLSDDEEMCEVHITRRKNRSELAENLSWVYQFQLVQFQPGLFSADRLFLQRP